MNINIYYIILYIHTILYVWCYILLWFACINRTRNIKSAESAKNVPVKNGANYYHKLWFVCIHRISIRKNIYYLKPF